MQERESRPDMLVNFFIFKFFSGFCIHICCLYVYTCCLCCARLDLLCGGNVWKSDGYIQMPHDLVVTHAITNYTSDLIIVGPLWVNYSYPTLPYPTLSYPILPYPILSCPILSCLSFLCQLSFFWETNMFFAINVAVSKSCHAMNL